MMTQTQYTPDEVVERGKTLYEQNIRSHVEKQNFGKLLMVDITTGEYVIGEERIEMSRRAHEKNPDAVLFGMRVGYPAAAAIGATLRPLSESDRPQWRVKESAK